MYRDPRFTSTIPLVVSNARFLLTRMAVLPEAILILFALEQSPFDPEIAFRIQSLFLSYAKRKQKYNYD